jgi:16S rRNA (guanine527-N7)-methyltransferase
MKGGRVLITKSDPNFFHILLSKAGKNIVANDIRHLRFRSRGMINFEEAAQAVAGISLDRDQIRAFESYLDFLLEWNQRINLTAITDPEEIWRKHFLDSLSCLKAIPGSCDLRLIDIGTGAGFPGIPLKIAVPEIQLTLVDSVGKKAEFCRLLSAHLRLRDVTILHARAEEVGVDPRHREQYDGAVARAVARLPVLAEYLLPLVKVGGWALAQKGESGPQELEAAAAAVRLLGGAPEKIVPVEYAGVAEKRFLILLGKRSPTPSKYPRRAGAASKKPLGE